MTPWQLSASERITAAQSAVLQIEEALADAVAFARSGGATWDEIAAALGIARQSAWRRFKEGRRMKRRQRRCSFCGLHQKDTKHLVAAPTGAAICEECVRLSASMIDAEATDSGRS
jgi:ClpX C4-type zinc finger protein